VGFRDSGVTVPDLLAGVSLPGLGAMLEICGSAREGAYLPG
jgi:hypothetical protein